MSSGNQQTRLTKSSSRVLAGVCGGIAEFLGWEPRRLRFVWAGLTVLTGVAPGALAYALLAIVMPNFGESAGTFRLEDHRSQ